MSHELPEDMSQWPSDHYQLLGVERTSLARDVKRAYTRLIRTYKPELYPEQFRRIREAYEIVSRYLEWSIQHDLTLDDEISLTSDSNSKTPNDVEQSSEGALDVASSKSSPPTIRPIVTLDDQLDRLWTMACDGQPAVAYQQLVELAESHPANPQICLRCYWLLLLDPQLDRMRDPCHWLTTGLRASRLTGPLHELYRRELERSPDEAKSPRCTALLEGDSDPWSLTELVEARWRAAASQGDPSRTISHDLGILRNRLLPHHEEYWLQTLVHVLASLMTVATPAAAELVGKCRAEVQMLEHMAFRNPHQFDRFDVVMETGRQLRNVGNAHSMHADALALVKLVGESWSLPWGQLRIPLLTYLQRAVERWHQAIYLYDHLRDHAGLVLARFAEMLDQFEGALDLPVDSRDENLIRDLVIPFAYNSDWFRYVKWRPELIAFCQREAISPERFAACIQDHSAYRLTTEIHIADAIMGDRPLRCICQSMRLFWAA